MSKAFRIVIEQEVRRPDSYDVSLFVRGTEKHKCARDKHRWDNKIFSVGQEPQMFEHVLFLLSEAIKKVEPDRETKT